MLNDDFDWTWNSGSTSTANSGPTADHTFSTATGHYMYIETSAPRRQGDKARLISKTYPPINNRCLTFWYHMYGLNIGQLNVYAGTPTSLGTAIWNLYGNQGNRWLKAQVTVQTSTAFQVQSAT
ncbi:hypothetical protein DPMN_011726 [Dreissena polymorpha]|uniref:MAM domain-containing protein n=1 Tax=Dreissena polymorpha TaxID=45954 RepID=A0A9D4N139_DREPO|nr:hypothetical protein DPMN_011726 [Dreissena polymorpha]